jgi:hypothetical protein
MAKRQGDLFEASASSEADLPKADRPAKKGLEAHEHCFIRGERANKSWLYKFSHSHEGGDIPHQHPDTGPASYTIDKDEWLRATGLRGGGRKKFTKVPDGDQFPIVELEEWQKSFEIVVCPPPKEFKGVGPGIALPLRLIKTFGMTVSAVKEG